MAQLEVLVSCGLVRAKGGSLADQYLLAVGPSGSLPSHPGLPLASGSHLSICITQDQQEVQSENYTHLLPDHTHPPSQLSGLPVLQGQPPCPQMPPYSGGSGTVCLPD